MQPCAVFPPCSYFPVPTQVLWRMDFSWLCPFEMAALSRLVCLGKLAFILAGNYPCGWGVISPSPFLFAYSCLLSQCWNKGGKHVKTAQFNMVNLCFTVFKILAGLFFNLLIGAIKAIESDDNPFPGQNSRELIDSQLDKSSPMTNLITSQYLLSNMLAIVLLD